MYIKIDDSLHEDIRNTNYTDNKGKLEHFGPISKLNILVGANSSGKSRFMRGLIKSKVLRNINTTEISEILSELKMKVEEIIQQATFDDYNPFSFSIGVHYNSDHNNTINNSHKYFLTKKEPITVTLTNQYFRTFIDELVNDWNKGNAVIFSEKLNLYYHSFNLAKNIINNPVSANTSRNYGLIDYSYEQYLHTQHREAVSKINELLHKLRIEIDIKINDYNIPQKIYIPILRSANSLYVPHDAKKYSKYNENIFESTVKQNYDLQETENLEIITGLDLYKKIRRIRNSRKSEREDFYKFEQFMKTYFFQGQDVDIVAMDTDESAEEHITIHFSIESGKDREIHNLGDGIQQIIIMMYPIFTAPKGAWIFIEEPEINLHPGLQRIFIEQLLNNEDLKEKDLTIFITTHSNHLLDLSLEMKENVSIFTFEKSVTKNTSSIKVKNVINSDTDILKLLGVNNSSVFMANCSIWVEGISDRIYLRAYLKAFNDYYSDKTRYKEDLHYAFFEYAGSNVSHYLFLSPNELEDLDISEEMFLQIKAQFLSNKIFLMADQDSEKEAKHDSLAKQENKNFEYYPLPVREIENLLSPAQIGQFLTGIKFQKKITIEEVNRKSIEFEKYKNVYLGKYLVTKFSNLPKTFKAESGTIETVFKTKIAKFIAENIKWEDMSKEAQLLTEKLYEFIKTSNSQ
jgi:predicted ATP-dependent endonuclease of OLD family